MLVIRSSTNSRIAIHIDSELERWFVELVFRRGLNTYEGAPQYLLDAHEQLKRPLTEHAAPEANVTRDAEQVSPPAAAAPEYVELNVLRANGVTTTVPAVFRSNRPLPVRCE